MDVFSAPGTIVPQPRFPDQGIESQLRLYDATERMMMSEGEALINQLRIEMDQIDAIYTDLCVWMSITMPKQEHESEPEPKLEVTPSNYDTALAQEQQKQCILQQFFEATQLCKYEMNSTHSNSELQRHKQPYMSDKERTDSLVIEEVAQCTTKSEATPPPPTLLDETFVISTGTSDNEGKASGHGRSKKQDYIEII